MQWPTDSAADTNANKTLTKSATSSRKWFGEAHSQLTLDG